MCMADFPAWKSMCLVCTVPMEAPKVCWIPRTGVTDELSCGC